MTKPAKKKTTTKKPASKKPGAMKTSAMVPAKAATAAAATKPPPATDDDLRLRRNAKLREWRAAHADQQRVYMAEWRAKRKANAGDRAQIKTDTRNAGPSSELTGINA